jgi:hypothetical protein
MSATAVCGLFSLSHCSLQTAVCGPAHAAFHAVTVAVRSQGSHELAWSTQGPPAAPAPMLSAYRVAWLCRRPCFRLSLCACLPMGPQFAGQSP